MVTHTTEGRKRKQIQLRKIPYSLVCVCDSPSTALVPSKAKSLERKRKKMRDLMGEKKAGKFPKEKMKKIFFSKRENFIAVSFHRFSLFTSWMGGAFGNVMGEFLCGEFKYTTRCPPSRFDD